jgi:hypothetical protein
MRDCPYDVRLQRIAATPQIVGDMGTGQMLMFLAKTTRGLPTATSLLPSIRKVGQDEVSITRRTTVASPSCGKKSFSVFTHLEVECLGRAEGAAKL